MHFVTYVLLPVSNATTSLQARQQVMTNLSANRMFVGKTSGAKWPIYDWFVIGGRWSSNLYPQQLREEFFIQANQLKMKEKELGCPNTVFLQNNRKQLDKLWQELGGKNANPITRDQHNDLGEEDDAQILSKMLAERLNFFLKTNWYIEFDDWIMRPAPWPTPLELTPAVISLEFYLLSDLTDFNDLVGKYWVVVLDCHK
jgi:hypothetical protein